MLLASLAWTRKGHPPFWIRVWGCFGENKELPIAAATKINIKWMCPHCETLAVTFTIPVFKSWVQSTKKNFLHIYNWRKEQSCLSSAYVLLRKGVTQLLELHLESLAVCKGRAVFPESFLGELYLLEDKAEVQHARGISVSCSHQCLGTWWYHQRALSALRPLRTLTSHLMMEGQFIEAIIFHT